MKNNELDSEATVHPLRETVSALRFLALREEVSARYAITSTSDDAGREATKHHHQMIAFRIAAATVENLALDNDSLACRDAKALARGYEKHRREIADEYG